MPSNPYHHLFRTLRFSYVLLRGVLILTLVLIFVNSYFATIFRVDGSSMSPTLVNHQLVLVNLTAYVHRKPKVGDIVIVQYNGNASVRFVKRITGIPGSQVEFQGAFLTLPSDEYFVEGDNRDHSTDSRVFGPVSGESIIGKLFTQSPVPASLH